MTKPVINIHDAKAMDTTPEGSTRFGARIAQIGEPLGMTGLGMMYVTVDPGKRAFPFHNHLGTDEMFVILEGSGTYRFGEAEHAIKAGDVLAAPKGGPDTAHQIINTSDKPLKYLGISNHSDPEIVEYPDSGKFACLGIAPGKDFWHAHLKYIGRTDTMLGYFDGEEL